MQRKQLLGKTPLSSLDSSRQSKCNDFLTRENFSLFRSPPKLPGKSFWSDGSQAAKITDRLCDCRMPTGRRRFSPRLFSVVGSCGVNLCLFRNSISRCFIHDLQSFAVVNDMFYIIFSSSLACCHFPKRPRAIWLRKYANGFDKFHHR